MKLTLERWESYKLSGYILVFIMAIALIVYGIDLVSWLVVWVSTQVLRLFTWWRDDPDEAVKLTVHDLDWRGPDTLQAVDNDYYRNNIRPGAWSTVTPTMSW